jgi:hypothetical protein
MILHDEPDLIDLPEKEFKFLLEIDQEHGRGNEWANQGGRLLSIETDPITGNRFAYVNAQTKKDIPGIPQGSIYKVDLSKVNPDHLDRFSEVSIASGKQIFFEVAPGGYGLYSDDRNGSTPPVCEEPKFTVDDFKDVIRNAKSKEEAVCSFPPGVMSKFTLVYDSKSLQAPGTNKTYPRVIRTTADGKFSFSYTCNPDENENPNLNKFEVIFQNEETKDNEFFSVDFKKAPGDRMHENSKSCIGCHQNRKHIWADYPNWEGTYGSNDDILDPNDPETKDYLAFREANKDNPCYQCLPWPEPKKGDQAAEDRLSVYPYTKYGKHANYNFRPNSTMSFIYGTENARRILRKAKKNPQWENLKYITLMSSIPGCIPSLMKENLPVDDINRAEELQFRGEKEFFAVLKQLGVEDKDWSIRLNREGEEVETASYNLNGGNVVQAPQIIQAEMLKELAAEDNNYKSFLHFEKAQQRTANYGDDMKCFDDWGDRLLLKAGEKAMLCKMLWTKVKEEGGFDKEYFAQARHCWDNPTAEIKRDGLIANVGKIVGPTMSAVDRGEKVFKDRCLRCHDYGDIEANFRDENGHWDFGGEKNKSLDRMERYINKGFMPYDSTLNPKDKADVLEYLKSVKANH